MFVGRVNCLAAHGDHAKRERSMQYRTIDYKEQEHYAVLEIVATDGGDSSAVRVASELAELCSEISGNQAIRVVVLTSNCGTFLTPAVGLDESVLSEYGKLADTIAKMGQPVIVVLNGDLGGLGLEVALACDIRMAEDTARMSFVHVREGMIPSAGGTQRLARTVGKGKALELLLTAETIDAAEALRIGLVNRILPPGEARTAAIELAREMATKSPVSLRYAKEAIYKGMDLTLEQGLRLEADLYFLMHSTKDRTEGIQAFLAKRPANFEGC